MKTFPGSESSSGETKSIFEEWRLQYSTNGDMKINFGNDDVIRHLTNLGPAQIQIVVCQPRRFHPEPTPFKLKFVISRRDLIRYR
jgi:hypothetical protein